MSDMERNSEHVVMRYHYGSATPWSVRSRKHKGVFGKGTTKEEAMDDLWRKIEAGGKDTHNDSGA